MPTPGAWTTYGEAWREPVGPIHWAASDYADRWYGFFDGALASGASAAAAVTVLVGAAIGNAIFDATGVRMRQTPFSPEWVKEALKARA